MEKGYDINYGYRHFRKNSKPYKEPEEIAKIYKKIVLTDGDYISPNEATKLNMTTIEMEYQLQYENGIPMVGLNLRSLDDYLIPKLKKRDNKFQGGPYKGGWYLMVCTDVESFQTMFNYFLLINNADVENVSELDRICKHLTSESEINYDVEGLEGSLEEIDFSQPSFNRMADLFEEINEESGYEFQDTKYNDFEGTKFENARNHISEQHQIPSLIANNIYDKEIRVFGFGESERIAENLYNFFREK